MRSVVILLVLLFAGCSPRGELIFAKAIPGTHIQPVHTVDARNPLLGNNAFGAERALTLRYSRIDVSIPPSHEPGNIEWARNRPLPAKHFAAVGQADFDGPASFLRSVAGADTDGLKETILFVHGYNTTHGEAVYELAQMAKDFEVTAPVVLFSWQSAGDVRGYVYDRDSTLFARDDLEQVLRDLTGQGRKVFLVGHSMGSSLIMETLRQIAVSGDRALLDRLSGVSFMAPDIDPDLFRRQALRIGELPQPFIIFVAEKDEVLGISAFLTGRRNRLGTITNPEDLGGLPVILIDLTRFAEDSKLNHNIGTQSKAAIAMIRNLTRDNVIRASPRPNFPAVQ
ncbi:alpha/beta hydrolase [Halovulum sp. GXIMD14793]